MFAAAFCLVAMLIVFPEDKPAPSSQTLGDKITAACKPLRVSDWNVDPVDPSVIKVSCFNQKTNDLKTTAVER